MAFDQFRAHLVCKKCVFEIGTIVNARRQHCDHRFAIAAIGRTRLQRPAQILWVTADFTYADRTEQFGEHVHHRFPVFQHIGYARWRSGIIFKHIEFVALGSDEVDADNMRIDMPGWREADHRREESPVIGNQCFRNAAGADDFLPVINIVKKGVDRTDTLLDPARQPCPFLRPDYTWDDIEGNEPLFGLGCAIDVEGDSGAAEQRIGLFRFAA
jgi:hypothetical protein